MIFCATKIIRDGYSEIVGRGPVLLSVPPTPGQSGELYVGQVAEEAALLSKAHAIIAKEPKVNLDLTDMGEALSEFDRAALQFLQDLDEVRAQDIRKKRSRFRAPDSSGGAENGRDASDGERPIWYGL